ncbi:MAG: DUF1080 domain-containing protein [Planctomycetales bacterium]|nr:DUF1080 domain-containing protein [Planctomycetales bacterium]
MHLPVACVTALAALGLSAATGAEPEFTPLFDGHSLSGWVGETDAYEVIDGVLASKPDAAGKIYTKDEYDNFVLRLEFKLTAGANNGVALRAPGKGDPAYDAMECQVLDNTAEVYKDLKDYQYHGSIYGVAPAKRGLLKPVGEWNREEIRCQGTHVKVTLNGEVIVDVDLEKAAPDGKTIDGKQHPGLFRESGRIGLLGHGARVYFRNLEVYRLSE